MSWEYDYENDDYGEYDKYMEEKIMEDTEITDVEEKGFFERFLELFDDTEDKPKKYDEKEVMEALQKDHEDWAETIDVTEKRDLREKSVQDAGKFLEKEKALEERFRKGEIDDADYYWLRKDIWHRYGRSATLKSDLASADLTFNDIGAMLTDLDCVRDGNLKKIDANDEIKHRLETIGPHDAQRLADERYEEGLFNEDEYDRISNYIGIKKWKKK